MWEMLPWIVARASGFVAFGLLTAAVMAGLLVRTRTPIAGLRGSASVDLHRHLSLLALLATGVHGLALLQDRTIDITPLALVVPGLVPYREVWTGLGVVAAELALVIHLSFEWRSRIGAGWWRRLHRLAVVAFLGAAAHGLAAGTDSGSLAALALYGGAVGGVTGLTAWRIATAGGRGPRRRAPAAAGTGRAA